MVERKDVPTKMGRPRKGQQVRSVGRTVRMTPAEDKAINDLMEATGKTFVDLVLDKTLGVKARREMNGG